MKIILGGGPLVRGLGLMAVAASAVACDDATVVEDRPTEVVLTAMPLSAAMGQTVTFRVEAQGIELAGVALDYGDGAADSLAAHGAQTAGATWEHAYAAADTYEAIATVLEGSGRTHSDTVVISVSDPSGN